MFDPKTKILVVDDMLTMRKIIMKILRELGFSEMVEAQDGNDAWTKIQAGGIGLVISDWNMPNCTGLEFLKKVRADKNLAKTPFVLVTAEAEKGQVAEAVTAGVDQYVVKPFTKEALVVKLEMVHKRYAAKKAG